MGEGLRAAIETGDRHDAQHAFSIGAFRARHDADALTIEQITN